MIRDEIDACSIIIAELGGDIEKQSCESDGGWRMTMNHVPKIGIDLIEDGDTEYEMASVEIEEWDGEGRGVYGENVLVTRDPVEGRHGIVLAAEYRRPVEQPEISADLSGKIWMTTDETHQDALAAGRREHGHRIAATSFNEMALRIRSLEKGMTYLEGRKYDRGLSEEILGFNDDPLRLANSLMRAVMQMDIPCS